MMPPGLAASALDLYPMITLVKIIQVIWNSVPCINKFPGVLRLSHEKELSP